MEVGGLQRGVLHLGLGAQVFRGRVIHGFKRGSKELGCPTANLPVQPYEKVLSLLPLGVYWGLARIGGRGEVFGMALNVGWSPFYANKEKTIEVHVLAQLDDFYGEHLACVALGYVRPEANFKSVEVVKEGEKKSAE